MSRSQRASAKEACAQDQDLDREDFANLQARLRQNPVQEKISNLWFEHLLDQAESELVHV